MITQHTCLPFSFAVSDVHDAAFGLISVALMLEERAYILKIYGNCMIVQMSNFKVAS